MRHIFISLLILLGVLAIAEGKTLKVDTLTPSVTNGDLSLTPDGTGSVSAAGRFKVVSTSASSVPCPKMTQAQRDALSSPASGDCVYNADTSKTNSYNGAAWVDIGSGGGGGLDAFLSEDFETTQATDFSTGNNATFLTAGTIDGALANETSSPVAGARSLKYTASTASTNDWIASNSISLDAKQRGQFVGISFYYKWSGSVDVELVAQCTAGDTAEFTSSLDVISTATSNTRFSTSIFISSSCTALKYGFHFVNAPTNGDILIFDDVELSTNPFVYKNLVERGSWNLNEIGSNWNRTGSNVIYRNSSAPTFTELGNTSALTFTNDGTDGFKVIATKKCLLIVATAISSGSGSGVNVLKNGTTIKTGGGASYDGPKETPLSVEMEAGDYITWVTGSLDGTRDMSFSFSTITESEHVITPVKSNMTDLASYTPTFTGFGTPASSSVKYARIGKYLYVVGTFVSGTQTSEEYKIGLPIINGTQLTIASDHVSDVPTGQLSFNAATGATDYAMGGSVGNSYFNLYNHPEAGAYAVINTSGPMPSSGSTYYFSVTVPIEGWTSDVVILGAIPMNLSQEKFQSSNLTGVSQDISELQFNNLTIGKRYRVGGQLNVTQYNNEIYVNFRSAASNSGTLYSQQYSNTNIVAQHPIGLNFEFEAVSTSMYVYVVSAGSTIINGDGTNKRTSVILTEINYAKSTTRF